jgi:Tol biopolymer transport system component
MRGPVGIGTRLGPYEVTAKLGEGGMGEVYRATDSKLRREVAIKVLPAAFTADPDRLARFEREAQLLAQLHHPNIASIFGLEESGDLRALVMELVGGPTLAERTAAGPVPLEESVDVALQIAAALEEAHAKGIVHRDLKPQNIKWTSDGKVKVLEFGLAKAMDPVADSSSRHDLARSPTLMNSPTLTAAGTQLGVILGTAAYMAPEQARGGATDRRADIWSFGVVLYEMLAGRSLFAADTVSDTLAGVLKNEIDLSALPAETPAAIRRLLRRCLERNPKDRLHDIADARIELQGAMDAVDEEQPERSIPASLARRPSSWRLALVAVAATGAGLAAGWFLRSTPEVPALVRGAIQAPVGTELVPTGDYAGPVAVSPDGRQIAFTARDGGGVTRLYVQALGAGTVRAVPGSDGARYPFWSPDSRSLGFFDGEQLFRIELGEGAPLALAAASGARGGTWGRDGVIVFAPSWDSALAQIPAEGGRPTPASVLDAERREGTHRFPSFLPDGRHFLFEARGYNFWMRAQAGIFVGSIDDPGKRVRLLEHASNAMLAGGHVLFVRNGDLCAQRLDANRLALSGPVTILARDVRFDRRYSLGVFSATAGVLVLQHGAGQDENELVWMDRSGQRLERVDGAANHDGIELSPDASRALVSIFDLATSRSHLAIFDLESRSSTRLTFGDADDYCPVWSPDGSRIVFARASDRGIGLWIKPADGSTAERPFRPETSGELLCPMTWHPDGSRVLLTSLPGGSLPTGYWTLPASGEGAPERYTDSRSNGDVARFSPDGRWVAFDANEGRGEATYLARYPDTGGRWQLEENTAFYSRWTRGGREIVYTTSDGGSLTALPVDLSGPAPRFGRIERLFTLPAVSVSGSSFDVAPDGERILALVPAERPRPTPYTLVLNWERLLEPPGRE